MNTIIALSLCVLSAFALPEGVPEGSHFLNLAAGETCNHGWNVFGYCVCMPFSHWSGKDCSVNTAAVDVCSRQSLDMSGEGTTYKLESPNYPLADQCELNGGKCWNTHAKMCQSKSLYEKAKMAKKVSLSGKKCVEKKAFFGFVDYKAECQLGRQITPWCYTDDKTWEFCYETIDKCSAGGCEYQDSCWNTNKDECMNALTATVSKTQTLEGKKCIAFNGRQAKCQLGGDIAVPWCYFGKDEKSKGACYSEYKSCSALVDGPKKTCTIEITSKDPEEQINIKFDDVQNYDKQMDVKVADCTTKSGITPIANSGKTVSLKNCLKVSFDSQLFHGAFSATIQNMGKKTSA